MMNEKGKYYTLILNIMGVNKHSEGPKYLYKEYLKSIYDSIPHYFEGEHVVDKEEFKFSMTYALADVFNGGCEPDEVEGMWDFLN